MKLATSSEAVFTGESLSARRAWIETAPCRAWRGNRPVALRKEGVD
ncbi:hypothetical protein HMPREF1326_02609 [Akkermansia sp. KLE1605]|nr:hypothetical protein HMPREF1326_02609 [Akkermansia sp. KLE1605]